MPSDQLQDDDHPKKIKQQLHFVMFPWFAYGHITPYLHLSNELAKRGHKITFLTPPSDKTKHRLQRLIHHPTLITLVPLNLHPVPGLPPAAATTSDIELNQGTHLATAYDLTRPQVEEIITKLQPHFVLSDTAYWIPDITRKLGITSISYHVISAAIHAMDINRKQGDIAPPPDYPSPNVWPRGTHELQSLKFGWNEFGGVTLNHRINSALRNNDTVAFRTCRELEGKFCDYISTKLDNRPVLLTGPVLPPPDTTDTILDERWARWLSRFREHEVVYCAFGSQSCFDKEQVTEILLGLELTGLPFFAALAPPHGCSKINDAFPEGFEERVLNPQSGRGLVYGGWVQQPVLLNHQSIGCFVNHCGYGTMWEGILSHCQLVLAPQLLDQVLSTRNLTEELKIAVEVEKEEDNGWISKESLCKAVKCVMDEGSEVGDFVKKNHDEWRKRLISDVGFMEGYVDDFVSSLKSLLIEKRQGKLLGTTT